MKKFKILVVDDESRMRKLLNDFLSANNYEILEAENGQKALDIFEENKDISLLLCVKKIKTVNL